MLTMGGGAEIIFLWCAGGASFLRGSNSSQNKLKPPRSGKVIIICTVKTVTRGSHKKIVGGGGKTKSAPSSHYGEKDPPRGENSPYVEKKTSHIKNAPIGRKAPYGITKFFEGIK